MNIRLTNSKPSLHHKQYHQKFPGKYKTPSPKWEGRKCYVANISYLICVPDKFTPRKNATTPSKRETVIISLTGHGRTACPATFDLTTLYTIFSFL